MLVLLPRQKERIQERLLRWGYPPYIVENMEPFSLMSHYNHELKKRARMHAEQDDALATGVIDDNPSDITIDPDNKYKGVSVPYKW
ncbi:hypothetical protein ACOBQJ_04180 [Pelotomaculum propionicicum]|uniref:hypothetical protein n=1 Tax=Pelotomaculum propionicicum TaxID=258475 RepID=UPI003B77BD36